jgi:hypothetical protein
MSRLFYERDAENHFQMITEVGLSYKDLVNDTVPAASDQETEAEPPPVPDHLKAKTTDDRFGDPVRMHGIEGSRDASQPFQATKKWHLRLGRDGRPEFADGEFPTDGMKLSYDPDHGCILVPTAEPTVRPSWKPLGQKDYPGHN